MFRMLDGKEPLGLLRAHVLSHTTSETRMQEVRRFVGPPWTAMPMKSE